MSFPLGDEFWGPPLPRGICSLFADRMIGGGGDTSYKIARSLRFNNPDGAYLSCGTWPTNGNQQKATLSVWVKRSAFGAIQEILNEPATGADIAWVRFAADDRLEVWTNSSGSVIRTNAYFRDATAWMHLVVAIDTTQATAANRCRVYINGTEVTSFASATYWAQNANLKINNTSYSPTIGARPVSGNWSGLYLAEYYWIDGQQLTPTAFGKTDQITGQWVPIKYLGTYGANGFFLDFSDNTSTTTLGYDRSGNGNDWALTNFSVAAGAGNDSLLDTPTDYADSDDHGNFCVLTSIAKFNSTNAITLSNGGLDISTGALVAAGGTVAIPSTGKWYWEVTVGTATGVPQIGIARSEAVVGGTNGICQSPYAWGYLSNGNKGNNNSFAAYGATFTSNDVIGVAFDADAGTLTFYKNNASQGSAFTGLTSGPYLPMIGSSGASAMSATFNFGQRPFAYTPPTGHKRLCGNNLVTPSIAQGNKYADIGLYTGNGTLVSLTGLGFQPDVVIGRTRGSVTNAFAYDSGRGTTKRLDPVDNTAEATVAQGLTAFNADGFTMGSDADHNTNAATYWTMLFKKGATLGVDVVTYTGDNSANRNIAHNLGASPKMALVKRRDSTGSWYLWHAGFSGAAYFTTFEGLTEAESNANSPFGTGNWSSTQFMVTNNATNNLNASGATYVAILFAEVAGFSRIHWFDGNNSADGPFIWCGFKPAFLLHGFTTTSYYVECYDARRNTYNPRTSHIWPGQTNAENFNGDGFYNNIDFLANGFKYRKAGGVNTSQTKLPFIAFAGNPFKHARAA